MITKTCDAENTWTKWAYFDHKFTAGPSSASFTSTVTLQYSLNDQYTVPTASDTIVPIDEWTAQSANIVEPPEIGGWFRIGVDTGDYTDDVDVFMQG